MSVVGEIINNDQCYTSVKQISSTKPREEQQQCGPSSRVPRPSEAKLRLLLCEQTDQDAITKDRSWSQP